MNSRLHLLCALLCMFALTACKDGGQAQQGPMAPPVAVHEVKVADVPWPAEFQAQATGSRAV